METPTFLLNFSRIYVFQKDLIVWKRERIRARGRQEQRVSEGLNSVETQKVPGLSGEVRSKLVSEGLNSVETRQLQSNPGSALGSFRRT